MLLELKLEGFLSPWAVTAFCKIIIHLGLEYTKKEGDVEAGRPVGQHWPLRGWNPGSCEVTGSFSHVLCYFMLFP